MRPALFIIERPTPQRAPVLNELAARGLPLEVIYLHSDPAEQGWGDIRLRHRHTFADSTGAPRADQVARSLLRKRYSSLVSMGYRGSLRLAALTAARTSRTSVVMRFDTNQLQVEASDPRTRLLRRAAMRAAIPRSASAWSIGTQNERFWRKEIKLRRVVSIPYEVPVLPGDIDAFEVQRHRRSDPDALRFLYVGRLADIKNVDQAIAAFRALERPAWSFHIVGSGPQEQELRQQASGDDRISFMGPMTYAHLGAEFASADVLVLPSQGEPWGLVVNEALGYSLRVVASDQVGAAYDLLSNQTGEIYPVGDISALGLALRRCEHHLEQSPRYPQTSTADLMEAELRRIGQVRE